MAAEPPNDLFHDILDEILFRDPPNALKLTEVVNGLTRRSQVITFADGSQLAITAQVPIPPLADMTPRRVSFIKPGGEKGVKWDDGSNEAQELANRSVAMRFWAWIATQLDGVPESEKISCPSCFGSGRCLCCNGKGCVNCENNGRCPDCWGRGVIPKE